jgi:hypothetical protein
MILNSSRSVGVVIRSKGYRAVVEILIYYIAQARQPRLGQTLIAVHTTQCLLGFHQENKSHSTIKLWHTYCAMDITSPDPPLTIQSHKVEKANENKLT